jgi:hypothetical protein
MAIRLRNVHISGAHTGIKSDGPIDLITENVTFDNVRQPYDISGARSADISGTRITNDPKARRPSSTKKSSLGWQKINGPPLPAFCPSCKSIFPSRNYNLGGAYFNAWDNEETCPECGFENAKLAEGIFDLASEAVKVLSAPNITHAMLLALRNACAQIASTTSSSPTHHAYWERSGSCSAADNRPQRRRTDQPSSQSQ